MLQRNSPFLSGLCQSHSSSPWSIDALRPERATDLSGDVFAYATLPQAGLPGNVNAKRPQPYAQKDCRIPTFLS